MRALRTYGILSPIIGLKESKHLGKDYHLIISWEFQVLSVLRRHRAISTFLILSLSFLLPLASAHSDFNTLIEADFLTQGAKFEAGDLNDLWLDKQTNLDFRPSESLIFASPGIRSHRLLIPSSYQVVPIDSSFSVLRC